MRDQVDRFLADGGADIVRVVDLSGLHPEARLTMPCGIVFCIVLSQQFIRDMHDDSPTADEYIRKETMVEALADQLAGHLEAAGYGAHSQSEAGNMARGSVESAYIDPDLTQGVSLLPQKTLARMAGIGYVGKNNLLVTEEYGCALALCSVLTDTPLRPDRAEPRPDRCGNCDKCKTACPGGALRGNHWSPEGGREAVLDVSKCCCPLHCMVYCPWTMGYAGIHP